jgi:hypothetical protein
MITRHPIKRKRYGQHTFSASAIEAYRQLRALAELECTCPPKPVIPPWTGDHPDPADPKYRAFYSAPPPTCKNCEARSEAATKVHVLAGFRPWWHWDEETKHMRALAAAAGLPYDDEDEDP